VTTAAGTERLHRVAAPFSLAATCGPVVWGGGRWPDIAWVDGSLIWIGREDERVVHRRVRPLDASTLAVDGSGAPDRDVAWLDAVLGVGRAMPAFDDPVLDALAARWPGLRPFASGSLLAGLVTSIVGQSVSVAAAAITVARLAALWHDGEEIAGRRMTPLPTAAQLRDADTADLRGTGMTWRRAEALVALGRAAMEPGSALTLEPASERRGVGSTGAGQVTDLDDLRATLRRLPLVGPWTVESALIWGLGESDVHPTGDAALLRATRAAYRRPDLDHRGLDGLAVTWRPHGGWAARLLWLDLLGPASEAEPQSSAAAAASR
jgi:3-methyladenine DNA glycosylase/8-oxoguanine DNA glycosylase